MRSRGTAIAPRSVLLGALLGVLLGVALSCAPARKPPAKAREIVFWQSWPAAVMAPLIADFEASHPGIQVRLEPLAEEGGQARILAAVDSGGVPDLCQVRSSWMPGLMARDKLSDWSAGVADQKPLLRGWEPCSMGDVLYGMPWMLDTRALLYNRDLFRRARLDPGRPPRTWAELRAAAARIQRLGGSVRGIGVQAGERHALAESVLPFLWGNGADLLSPDLRHAVLDSARSVEALEYYLGLRKVGRVGRQDVLEREFVAGRLGLLVSGARLLRRLPHGNPRLRCGVALMPQPAPDRGTRAAWAEGEVLVSFSDSRHKMEALELARFLVQPENTLRLAAVGRLLPADVGADTSAYYRARPLDQVFVRQLESARFTPGHPAWGEMEEAFEDEVGLALSDRKSAARAVRDAQALLAALVGKH